jgi:hypothetical protein
MGIFIAKITILLLTMYYVMCKHFVMIIWNENLADIIEDGNARRGWWMNLRREEDQFEMYLIDALIEDLKTELEESVAA